MTQPDLLPEYDWCLETLAHYRCTACCGWWTIGDGRTDRPRHCPHCDQKLQPAQYPETRRHPATPPQEILL